MPGVCCTHFEGGDCQAIQGLCADGCAWEEAAWERLAAYEDTGLEPEEVSEYQHLCDSYAETGLDSKFVQFCIDATQNGLSMNRIRELAQAEKDGRLVVLPPNDPLTLEELWEMDGEPVWIKSNNWHNKDKWGLVSVWTGPTGDKFAVYVYNTKTGATLYPSQEYGHCWLAYRRKPEEG